MKQIRAWAVVGKQGKLQSDCGLLMLFVGKYEAQSNHSPKLGERVVPVTITIEEPAK